MSDYVGRFAPSPSGPLHMGSLLAALASYLQARQNNGRWLLRIEDIDPTREPRGAADNIIDCLSAHGLMHDGAVSFQSTHSDRYEDALSKLRQNQRLFACRCTRSTLRRCAQQSQSNAYPETCKNLNLPEQNCALRLRLADNCRHSFEDQQMGTQCEDLRKTCGDFVLRRRDGLYAYQLAVVVDDAAQGISEVVRGADLLDNTVRQIHLQYALGLAQPRYFHLPLMLGNNGLKLSKQNHAPALDIRLARQNLAQAWASLGQKPLSNQTDCHGFLKQAILQWNPSLIPKTCESKA